MGKAKERAAREEAKKAEARDEFTRLLRHTKSLKLDSTWEDIKPDLETHSAYKDVSNLHLQLKSHGDHALLANKEHTRQKLAAMPKAAIPFEAVSEASMLVLECGISVAAPS